MPRPTELYTAISGRTLEGVLNRYPVEEILDTLVSRLAGLSNSEYLSLIAELTNGLNEEQLRELGLQRTELNRDITAEELAQLYPSEYLQFDPKAHTLSLDTLSVNITGGYTIILTFLLRNFGRVVSRQTLEELLCEANTEKCVGNHTQFNRIQTIVSRVKKKLDRIAEKVLADENTDRSKPQIIYIENIRKTQYTPDTAAGYSACLITPEEYEAIKAKKVARNS